jgi:hypothetical protein
MSKIIVSAAGWCEADPEKVRFQLITDMDDQEYITGTEWLKLPEYHDTAICRDDYILECVGKAFDTAIDGEYGHVEVEVEE